MAQIFLDVSQQQAPLAGLNHQSVGYTLVWRSHVVRLCVNHRPGWF